MTIQCLFGKKIDSAVNNACLEEFAFTVTIAQIPPSIHMQGYNQIYFLLFDWMRTLSHQALSSLSWNERECATL